MWNYILTDEKAQISAEMILILGAIMVIVIVVGKFVFDMSNSTAGNISDVTNNARDTSIGKM
jgi:uncharacterized protein (UPF0333 family)